MRHLARVGDSLKVDIRWVEAEGTGAVELEGRPVLCLELLTKSPPPDSTATGLRRVESGERSWLGSLSRAVSGHMKIDGASGVISLYFPALPRPGQVSRPTALLACQSATTRRHTANLLQEAGFSVLTVEDADRALVVAAECPQALSLLVCDASFPVMSCAELHDEVARRHSEVRAIYLNRSSNGFVPEFEADWAVLTTPVAESALARLMRRWRLEDSLLRPRVASGA